jgi:hypothetical protein
MELEPITDANIRKFVRSYLEEANDYPALNEWDVSNVTNMSKLFVNYKWFNEPLDKWSPYLKNVTNMSFMFYGCRNFNQSLESWGPYLTNVTDMRHMFHDCHNFDQPLDSWGPSLKKVTDMNNMFYDCHKFDQPLDSWGPSLKKVTDMSHMFYDCHKFDQPLDSWGPYLTNVTDMSHMFHDCHNFDQPLDSWGWGPYLTNVRNMSFMFCKCINFNQPLDSWGRYLTNVTNMNFMFAYSGNLNQSFENWNINVNTDIINMFLDTSMQETNYPPRITSELILKTDTSYNLLSLEDENVLDYLKQDQNIVFKLNKIYYLTTKDTIFNLIDDGSAIKYGCRRVKDNLYIYEDPCFDLKKIGITSGGLVYLDNLLYLLNLKKIKKQAFKIVNKNPTLIYPSTASYQMLSNNPNAMSASHCQEGHETVYDLKCIHIATAGGKNEKQGKLVNKKTRKTMKTKNPNNKKTRKQENKIIKQIFSYNSV